MRCFSSPRYFVPLPAGHVFPMVKFPRSVEMLVADATLPGGPVDPGVADEATLRRVHTAGYVASIRTGDFHGLTARKLGLPPSEALWVRSRSAVAGTLSAARAALADGLACNLAGGTHHAFADSGQGFCVFNDVAIAVDTLRDDEPYLQVLVVDVDAHQGNGTHALLAGDRSSFTYSLHVGKNYPSLKVPGDLDVPLERWASSAAYFAALEATLPGVVEHFEPDLAFVLAGVDPHERDRFGQMRLTDADLVRRDTWVLDLLRDQGVAVAWLYSGGYQPEHERTAHLHAEGVRVCRARFDRERR